MPTLVIDNVPASLYARIVHLAKVRQRTPADTVLEVLETAFCATTATFSAAPLPQEPFLTEEIGAPGGIPWPAGKPTFPLRVAPPLPTRHDLPEE